MVMIVNILIIHRSTSFLLHFTDTGFFFYKLEVCGNPVSSKSIGAIFPIAFAHFVSLCHILIIFAIFQTPSAKRL